MNILRARPVISPKPRHCPPGSSPLPMLLHIPPGVYGSQGFSAFLSGSLPTTLGTFYFFLQPPLVKNHPDILSLSRIVSLGGPVRANGCWRFHSVLRASKRETTWYLALPTSFLHNPKLGQPVALLATCFIACMLLDLFFYPNRGGDMFSKISDDFELCSRRYIPETYQS